ncbi:MAG TPA: PH domain-containing protein [Clostridiaceae bacterium]
MRTFKSEAGLGFIYISLLTISFDVLLLFIMNLSNSYVINSLLKLTLIIFNLYQAYYLLIVATIKYIIFDEGILVSSIFGFKKTKILFSQIQAYKKGNRWIKGVKLSGYGNNSFAIGRTVIDLIGTTYMYVTSSKKLLYFKTPAINYAISPKKLQQFVVILEEKGIEENEWVNFGPKKVHLYKDINFIVPFLLSSLFISIMLLNPFILYLLGRLPVKMPLTFDAAFIPLKYGTGKQFALNQMAYGILNMAMLFCMHYASYFYYKYDKKSSYKFIYISLFISFLFLLIQFRILAKW